MCAGIVLATGGVAVASTPDAGTEFGSAAKRAEVCDGRVQNPHYSPGAKGVIFRAQARCHNTTSVRITGRLWFCGSTAANGCEWLRHQSTKTKTVKGNLEWVTWYFPPLGQNGASPPVPYCNGYWRGRGTFTANGDTESWQRTAWVQWCD